MSLDPCSECGLSVQREKAFWISDPDFLNGDPARAWNGGPVIFCPRCWRKRPKRIVAIEQMRKPRQRRRREVLNA